MGRIKKGGGWDKRFKGSGSGSLPEWIHKCMLVVAFLIIFYGLFSMLYMEISDGYFGVGSIVTLILVISWALQKRKKKLSPEEKKFETFARENGLLSFSEESPENKKAVELMYNNSDSKGAEQLLSKMEKELGY